MSKANLSIPEKLLLATLKLREKSRTFTAEDLVVEAWRMFPDTFGLAGYSDRFPDSNRILTNIMGTKGMRGKGWLRKVGEKQYNVSSRGISDGHLLLADDSTESPNAERAAELRAALDRSTSAGLTRLLKTSAARKALGRQAGDMSFTDAASFWDITARSNANTLNVKLSDIATILERAASILIAEPVVGSIKLDADVLRLDDVRKLQRLHEELQAQCKREIDVIRKRTDERKR